MAVEETQLIYVPDWPERAEARALVPWRKPRQRALLRAFGKGVQALEDESFNLIVSTDLDVAVGDALDQWGELVGEQRGGLGDNDYRQFVKVRMLVNRSNGTIDELLEIFDVATQPNVDTHHISNFPAGFYLIVYRHDWMSQPVRRRVARLMEDARPGGRHMSLIEALIAPFGFEDNPLAEGYDVGPFARLIK